MESNGSLLWSEEPDPGEAVHTPHSTSYFSNIHLNIPALQSLDTKSIVR
jgi:hypothetical protein